MVREFATHQCGSDSIPGPSIMWVEFVVGLILSLLRGFFSGFSRFPPPSPQTPTLLCQLQDCSKVDLSRFITSLLNVPDLKLKKKVGEKRSQRIREKRRTEYNEKNKEVKGSLSGGEKEWANESTAKRVLVHVK